MVPSQWAEAAAVAYATGNGDIVTMPSMDRRFGRAANQFDASEQLLVESVAYEADMSCKNAASPMKLTCPARTQRRL